MAALAHVFLHVGLCNAIARTTPQTTVTMRVQLTYPNGVSELDKAFTFARGEDPEGVVEFDMPRGTYRLHIEAPKYGCATSDYVDLLAEHNRNLSETLADRPQVQPPVPAVLMAGTAPISFLYVKPTFVLFDKSLTCKQPVPAPLPAHSSFTYDQGSFYVSLFSDPTLAEHAPVVVALRLKTPTGMAHYIRVPVALPVQAVGWPGRIHMDVTSDMIDDIATEKTETLLCPKVWETSVH